MANRSESPSTSESVSASYVEAREALALVASIVSLMDGTEGRETRTLGHVHRRIDVVATAYGMASRQERHGHVAVLEFLRELIEETDELTHGRVAVTECGECPHSVTLPLDRAIPLGLLVCELLPDYPHEVRVVGAENGCRVELTGPEPARARRSELLQTALTEQLGGSLTVVPLEDGGELCSIHF